jgi:hypothetical protein
MNPGSRVRHGGLFLRLSNLQVRRGRRWLWTLALSIVFNSRVKGAGAARQEQQSTRLVVPCRRRRERMVEMATGPKVAEPEKAICRTWPKCRLAIRGRGHGEGAWCRSRGPGSGAYRGTASTCGAQGERGTGVSRFASRARRHSGRSMRPLFRVLLSASC